MKIVVLDGFTLNPGDLSWHELSELAPCQVHDHTLADDVVSRCQAAEIILTNKTSITADILKQLPDIKYIGVLATGTNVVDLAYAKLRGIIVTNVPAYGPDAVAQMVFAHILHHTQQVALHDKAVKQGLWAGQRDFCFTLSPLMSLKGKVLGLIGFGDIAQHVAQIGLAFGMKVLVHTPKAKAGLAQGIAWCELAVLLPKAQFLSLHCPLTEVTHHMIDASTLAKLPSNALIINTARGDLINEQDLADWLNQDKGFAAVDVLSSEPPQIGNPLLSAKNITITPHIAWATKEARQNLMNIAVNNCRQFMLGEPVNVVSS
ncbi:D-2-hydroxyacid dehydrogenase [Shewanella sp. OMA3-2]|uniref:D-2-hydroxyacid dehydrogenase n=1 Tax=Shewanella sp. OMA3-2 TaxID=2908650 RepID=UPI001F333A26|nr:D-2-hydroxyacid dehydrogenase [Shewanella sp. OMA3-2]UJF23482.1 D-2-hydroxyacid dehydrogenase [Shewanella sp. OMA3-2]